MPTLPTSADRAAEFNRLLVEQGFVTRSMKYGWQPDDAERETIDARATRLLELAELMPGITVEPGTYVNDRLAAWLRMNPLALTNQILAEKLTTEGVHTISVQVGDPRDRGYRYALVVDDVEQQYGGTVLRVPDSVAEYFRQQGRRALQSELRDCLNVARA